MEKSVKSNFIQSLHEKKNVLLSGKADTENDIQTFLLR